MIPSIGFGTYQLRVKDAYDSVSYALEIGYRHIDTAVLYKNEAFVGKAIIDSKIPRKDIFLTTKVFNRDQIKGPDRIKKVFNDSLTKLQTDYVDLLLVHNPIMDKLADTWKVLEELYSEKKCRMIGVSNFEIEHLKYFDTNNIKVYPMVNQLELTPFNTKNELVEYCASKKIVIVAHTSLTRGVKLNHETIISIAKKYNITPAQCMLQWAQFKNYIIIPRSNIKEQIKENFLLDKPKLMSDDIKVLDSLNENFTLFITR
jgi:diketogulonate reductase-like aldo/keto reductase